MRSFVVALMPARSVGVDGKQVADLGDTFDVGGYLLHRLLLFLGVNLSPDVGHAIVDLDVQVWQVQSAGILTNPRPDTILDLFLLYGDVFGAIPMAPTDERTCRRIGVLPLGSSTVRILRSLVQRGSPNSRSRRAGRRGCRRRVYAGRWRR